METWRFFRKKTPQLLETHYISHYIDLNLQISCLTHSADVHPDVRCGEETRVIPRVLMARKGMKSEKSVKDLFLGKTEVGLDESKKIDQAVKRFILEIIEKHGPVARRLCNKDPFALKYMKVKTQLIFYEEKRVFLTYTPSFF